jgi:transcriptional regulator with XRE-family HTH domain
MVRERGWCQNEFARRAGLSLQTAREILEGPSSRRLQNRTIFGCARALGLSVAELRSEASAPPGTLNLSEKIISREAWRYDLATQPCVKDWLQYSQAEAATYTIEEIEELMSIQGTGGPLTAEGLEAARALLERKRELLRRVHAIAGTDYLDLLEALVSSLFKRVQPYGE